MSTDSTSSMMEKDRSSKSPVYYACIRDGTIGMADGLTVPFALTAALSSIGSSRLVITAGMAELFAGAISMGLGAYLAAGTKKSRDTVPAILERYGVSASTSALVDREIDPQFVKDFEGEEAKPWLSGLVMGMSYFIGGLVPMIPYFATDINTALFISIALTAVVLIVFGGAKEYATIGGKMNALKGAIKTLTVVAIAVVASYAIVRALNHNGFVE